MSVSDSTCRDDFEIIRNPRCPEQVACDSMAIGVLKSFKFIVALRVLYLHLSGLSPEKPGSSDNEEDESISSYCTETPGSSVNDAEDAYRDFKEEERVKIETGSSFDEGEKVVMALLRNHEFCAMNSEPMGGRKRSVPVCARPDCKNERHVTSTSGKIRSYCSKCEGVASARSREKRKCI